MGGAGDAISSLLSSWGPLLTPSTGVAGALDSHRTGAANVLRPGQADWDQVLAFLVGGGDGLSPFGDVNRHMGRLRRSWAWGVLTGSLVGGLMDLATIGAGFVVAGGLGIGGGVLAVLSEFAPPLAALGALSVEAATAIGATAVAVGGAGLAVHSQHGQRAFEILNGPNSMSSGASGGELGARPDPRRETSRTLGVRAGRKGTGVRWQDPSNPGNGIRIDRGNRANSQATQQVDHVVVRHNGRVIGRDGRPIEGSVADNPDAAHIPLSEWSNWNSWFSP